MAYTLGKAKQNNLNIWIFVNKRCIYLASPYTHEEPAVMSARCAAAQKAAARLMLEGLTVFSPIAHSHGISDRMPESLRCSHNFWLGQDLPLLARCDELCVLCLPGWETSMGIQAEMDFANGNGIPVSFLHGESI